MSAGITFTLASLFYIILLVIVFFSKTRIARRENKIYSYLIITSLCGVIVGLGTWFFMKNMDIYPLLNIIFSRLYLVYLITWLSIFCLYTIVITFPKLNYEKWKNYFYIAYFILFAAVFLLPLECVSEGEVVYSHGTAANLIYLISGLLIIILIYCMLKNRKHIFQKKYYPLILFMLLGGTVMVIQKLNPGLLLLTYTEAFITFLMYFTIENPDVSMLNELYKNKELMEQNYEDKYNFLFEMTQEARNPLVSMNSLYNEIRDTDDIKKIKAGMQKMNMLTRQLDFSINNILNISSLDVQKIKVVNSKYELDRLCNDLVTRIKPEVKDDVDFQTVIPKQMPTLYGDYMKLRQILYSLLTNACKNTTSGSISLRVNMIEKYDVARIIFNISDTGSGMPIEKINEIISSTGELEKSEIDSLEKKEYNVKVCQKVIKIMGGNLMIKSNVGEGTEVILTIDQRVFHEKDKSVLTQFENDIKNYRKVLVISQDKDVINTIKKKFNINNITYTILYSGDLGIDKIKSGRKFDFILVEDEMKEMSGFMTLKGMQEVEGFNTPVIIMLKEDKEHIKEHYLDDGFKDYLLLNNLDSELDRIVEKY